MHVHRHGHRSRPERACGLTAVHTLLGQNGNDALDCGPGANTNNGGPGVDFCVRPSSGAGATRCNPRAQTT
jgi:hypothetical protein